MNTLSQKAFLLVCNLTNMMIKLRLYLALVLLIFLNPSFVFAQVIPVEVKHEHGVFQLYRGGEPYYIKGAGGHEHLDYLEYLGGNSIRTWSPDDAEEILDRAHKKGVTVMMGLWVQHERHGFNYNDTIAVRKQLEYFTTVVQRLKDHPALLMWGIGNEVNLFYTNYKVWDAVQDIAAMIHRVDPNHPTSTVTAGLDSIDVVQIMKRAPDIDILGVNTYGDLHKVPKNIRAFGWNKSYVISEWGPTGHWEVEKTSWGAPIEQTSTEKSKIIYERYTNYIESDSQRCLGSYVFLWGQKQETTATWYGLFTEKSHPTEALEQLYFFWRKRKPPFAAASVDSVFLDGRRMTDNIILTAGDRFYANVFFRESTENPVKIQWMIFPESDAVSAGGDYEENLQQIFGLIRRRKRAEINFRAPPKEGAYRLFVFLTAKNKITSYANIPFYVNPRPENAPEIYPLRLQSRQLEIKKP
jgi:hypothetical protein